MEMMSKRLLVELNGQKFMAIGTPLLQNKRGKTTLLRQVAQKKAGKRAVGRDLAILQS